jgi:threonine dehydrogenase-like Zn-dependent dehydrogenase
LWGHSPAGLFGYSHLLGGFAGGQAEYMRVPYADVGPLEIPDGLSDEQVLFLSDIFPTGFMDADFCGLKGGETVAVWGCGPVGQLAIKSAFLLGAGRVIAIDTVPERLRLAGISGAITLDFKKDDIYERIQDLTDGRGADACIDAVGTEPDTGSGFDAVVDRIKVATFMGTDRPHVLRQAIHCCRNFGVVSIVGVMAGSSTRYPWDQRSIATCVSAIAACVIRFDENDSLDRPWAWNVMKRALKMREPSDFYGSKIPWHPSFHLISALFYDRKSGRAPFRFFR